LENEEIFSLKEKIEAKGFKIEKEKNNSNIKNINKKLTSLLN